MVSAMCSKRAMRFSVEGWVEKSCPINEPRNGLIMYIVESAGFAFVRAGLCFAYASIFSSALAKAIGFLDNFAPPSSAEYSRVLETASWTSIAASGANIIIKRRPMMFPCCRSRPPDPPL